MATTALWKVGTNLKRTIDYVSDKDKTNKNGDFKLKDLKSAIEYASNSNKTEDSYYVTGVNCESNYAYEEMMLTKKSFEKVDGIQAFHGYQSFVENEVTPDIAHEIGVKLAEEMWGDRFEVLVTTHLLSKNFHNHFVINSVSFVDGKKYRNTIANYAEMRRLNDELCREYGLNVLVEKTTPKSHIDYNIYKTPTDKTIQNYYSMAKLDLDNAIIESKSYKDFERLMYNMGYFLYYRANKLSIRNKKYKRNIRIERYFGSDYSIDNIKKRIYETNSLKIIKYNKKNFNVLDTKGSFIKLYKYYCYLLKIYPKNIRTNKISFEMRIDVEKLDALNKETNFLVNKQIDTKEDLEKLIFLTENDINILQDKKNKLWYQCKIAQDVEKKENIKDIIKKVNVNICELKKDLDICKSIMNRVEQINNNLLIYEEKIGKELSKDESVK